MLVEKWEVLRSWNHCHGAFYRISESDFLWNIQEQGLLRYQPAVLAGVPVLWADAAPAGAELEIPPGGLWLSLYGEILPGSEGRFAEAAEHFALANGKTRLAVGSDEFHFLPGIPVDEAAGERLAAAFQQRGFSSADCADFVGNPLNPKAVEYASGASADATQRGWTLKLVENDRDRIELGEFLAREFSVRWHREWKVWCARADTGRAFWNLLRDENGKVLGFSRLALRSRVVPQGWGWTPGAMRLPLSPGGEPANTDSCLGPIGIAASERGKGAGKILLGLSLHELSLQGAELTCIDWTNAYNYYKPLGFSIVRRYLTVWKSLRG